MSKTMTIHQCEQAAQDAQVDGEKGVLRFLWMGNGRVVNMRWLDPLMGVAQIEGQDGFVMTRSLDEACRDAKCVPMWDDE